MRKKIVNPVDVFKLLEKLEDSGTLYKPLVFDPETFRMEIAIGAPYKLLSQQYTQDAFNSIFSWVDSWKSFEKYGIGTVEYANKRIGTLRPSAVPIRLFLHDIQACFRYIHKEKEMECFLQTYNRLKNFDSRLKKWTLSEYKMLRYPCSKLNNFERVADKIKDTVPENAPYICKRELEIPGVDTKFFENNIEAIRGMYNALHGTSLNNVSELNEVLHIIKPPEDKEFIPVRFLDAKYRTDNISILKIHYTELKRLSIRPKKVYIVENKETFYHFPIVADSVVIFGAGISVSGLLKDVPFIQEAEDVYYWSDLDTNGFQMLSNMRKVYPKIHSFLMDLDTVMIAKQFSVEDTGSDFDSFENLTPSEEECFHYIKARKLRIEQEKIPWSYVVKKIENC